MKITEAEQKFIVHWGEMGTRWGINRTVAQIHALLYIAERPLHAEDIAETLNVARSNVSSSLKELQSWGIVKLVHIFGDKRDHFESLKDVWELFRVIVEERKRREIDPTLALLRECVSDARQDKQTGKTTVSRLETLLEFFETTTRWYDQIKMLPGTTLLKFMNLGEKAIRALT